MIISPVKFGVVIFCGCLVLGCARFKDAGRTIGHTTRDVTKEIGHGARNVTREIGHTTRDVTKEIGHGVRDVVRDLGDGNRDAEKTTEEEAKKGDNPGNKPSNY